MDSTPDPPILSMPPDSPADPSKTSGPPKKKSRLLRRVLLAVPLLVVAGLALGPPLASKWLRGEIERRGTERLHGRVTLAGLSLSLNGKLHLTDLLIEDEAGQMVARVPSAKADIGLRSLMGGKKDFAFLMEDAEVELVRSVDGEWNVAKLLREMPDDGSEETSEDEGTKSESPPDLHGRLEFLRSTLTVRDSTRALQIRDANFRVGFDGADREVTLAGDATLAGGDGSAGDFTLRAAVWADAGPGARLDEAAVQGLELGAMKELLAIVGSPLEEGSELEGELDLQIHANLSEMAPDSRAQIGVSAVLRDVKLDLRQAGKEALLFEDALMNLSASVQKPTGGGEPTVLATAQARGGKATVNVTWEGGGERGLAALFTADGLAASAGLEPFLARVHPVFAGAKAFDGANLDAAISTNVEVYYDAPLPIETLTSGWANLDKSPFRGTGTLSVDEGLVKTSPFFAQLMTAFDQPVNPSFSLKPLGFNVQAGRVTYTNPWTWTIEGTPTNFMGSVGLDQSLDLKWVVPIEGGLARQNSVLQSLAGESFEVALGGTLTSPTFQLASALTGLVQRAAQKSFQDEVAKQEGRLRESLEGKIGEQVGGDLEGQAVEAIGGILGGDVAGAGDAVKKAAEGILGQSNSAEQLLKDADKLWDEGKKKEAAAIYSRIRKEFPLSPVYLFNKKRIKGRRNG